MRVAGTFAMLSLTATFLAILFAAIFAAGVARSADNIDRIPRVGFKQVMRAPAEGLCARIADAIVSRESIEVGSLEAAQAILAVRPIDAKDFPKRVQSSKELLDRLPDTRSKCPSEQAHGAAAVLIYEKKPDGSFLRVLNHPIGECDLWGRDVICSGFVYRPGSIAVRFVRGSIKSGLEQITSGFGLSLRGSEATSLNAEQRAIYQQDPDSSDLPADFAAWFRFEVEPRQEEPWALILNRLAYVEDASRVPERVAGIGTDRIFNDSEAVNRLRRSPMTTGVPAPPNAQDRLIAFLHEWFTTRGGVLKVIKQDNHRLLLRVDRLRGEVIRTERFWEYLRVNLIMVEDLQRVTLYMINDGYYAAGLGDRLPAEASFIDMERDYYKHLSEYTEALATQIEARLRGTR